MNNLFFASWWNPFTWGEGISNAIHGMIDAILLIISNLFVGLAESSLTAINNMFNTSISALQSEVALTPAQFSNDVVKALENIGKVTVLPIAGIIITYIFCYELYTMITEKNKGGDFETQGLLFLIIKTFAMITLVTNAFNIALAFSDVGSWMVINATNASISDIRVDDSLKDEIIKLIEPVAVHKENGSQLTKSEYDNLQSGQKNDYYIDFRLGTAFMIGILSLGALIITMVMVAIIYLVAWSRLVVLLLYISVAPLPMATLMNTEWIGGIGQNYIKNLLALMLQGFLMVVLLVIYSGLLSHTLNIMRIEENALKALVLMLVSMGIVVKLLMGTHNFAKSITCAT